MSGDKQLGQAIGFVTSNLESHHYDLSVWEGREKAEGAQNAAKCEDPIRWARMAAGPRRASAELNFIDFEEKAPRTRVAVRPPCGPTGSDPRTWRRSVHLLPSLCPPKRLDHGGVTRDSM